METIIPPHILVVDDDTRLRALLHKFLSAQGFVVSTAANAAEAAAAREIFIFDLIVLDGMMPNVSGFEFLHTLRQQDATPVLMLTALGEAENRIQGLEAGADDYLTKPFEPKELALRIKAILKRAAPLDVPLVLTFGAYQFFIATQELHDAGKPVPLTSGEQQLLTLLAKNANTTVSREIIAASLGFTDTDGRAVDVHITRLRKKMEENQRTPRFLQTIRGQGYVLRV